MLYCANDVLAQGAQRLFFMDYYAAGKLNKSVAIEVIGIAKVANNQDTLIGETAEMPGHYKKMILMLQGFV